MDYSDLDLSRKRDMLGNSHSLVIAIANLTRFTGSKSEYWQALLAQESDEFILNLSPAQIDQAIRLLDEQKNAALAERAALEKSVFID